MKNPPNGYYVKDNPSKCNSREDVDDVEVIVNEKLITSKPSELEETWPIDTVEELYSALGNPGLYAKLVFAISCLNMLTIASNHAAGVFLDYSPDHTCHAFDKNTTSVFDLSGNTTSSTTSSPLQSSAAVTRLPVTSSRVIYSECHNTYVSENLENATHRCQRGQWKYHVVERESSSVSEWDLVCDRSNLAHLSSTLYFCGVMAGGLIFGYLSDVMGRRVAILMSLYASVGIGAGIAFTDNLTVYIVLRTIMGVTIQGFLTATYIRLLELFGSNYRGFAGNALYCVWGIALNYLGFMAWILKGWRLIQLACIAQAAIGIFYIWLIPESLRWLVAKGRVKQANELTNRIYSLNRCTDVRCLDPTLIQRLTGGNASKSASILDLFRNASLLRQTVILSYVTLAVNFGYWGLTYNTQALVGNRYQNFVLSTIPEIFVYVINIFVLNRFGRKRPMMFYFSVTALCCLVSCLLLSTDGALTLVMIVSTIGRLSACGLMGTNDVFMAESYPTLVRNTGVGVCVCVGRAGAVITPIIFSLTKYTFRGLPLLSFGVVTAVAVFMTMLLPDTWKRDLPETLHDLEMTVVVEAAPDVAGKESLLSNRDSEKKKEAGMMSTC